MKIINKALSDKVLIIGQKYKGKGPTEGLASVIASYSLFFDDVKIIPMWKYTNKINKLWYFIYHYIEYVFLLIFNRKIKIVHIHTSDGLSFVRNVICLNTAKLFGKKVVLHMHGANFEEYYNNSKRKEWILNSINKCDVFIVLSIQWKEYFKGIGIDENKIVILNNIVVPPTNHVRRDYNSPLRMLFLGWLGKRKGIWDLLAVIKDHADELRGKFILRFGGNEYENEIRKELKDSKIEDLATFEGWVSGDKKAECLGWADVFILPSYNEGLPISILEALSYGMPVISTPVGGITEVVHHKENGFIVTPGNKDEIWQAIKAFIDNPELISQYGDMSLEIVKPYTPESVMTHLKQIYEELL